MSRIKSELEKCKKKISTEQNNDKKKLIEISKEETNLELSQVNKLSP